MVDASWTLTVVIVAVETCTVVRSAVSVWPGREVVRTTVAPSSVVMYVWVSVLAGRVLTTVDTIVLAGAVDTIKPADSWVVYVST